MLEYEYEPVPGLPDHLPAGEVLLWQGAPRWRSLMRYGFHERGWVAYFGALLAWYAVSAARHGDAMAAAVGTARFALLAALAIGVLEGFAWLVARTTLYTVTSRRVVMRFGVALPITVNLPFKLIEQAGMRVNPDGSGDLLITVVPGHKVSYFILWPHVRPWHLLRVKPEMRGVADVERAGAVLGRALALAHGQAAGMMEPASGPSGLRPGAAVAA